MFLHKIFCYYPPPLLFYSHTRKNPLFFIPCFLLFALKKSNSIPQKQKIGGEHLIIFTTTLLPWFHHQWSALTSFSYLDLPNHDLRSSLLFSCVVVAVMLEKSNFNNRMALASASPTNQQHISKKPDIFLIPHNGKKFGIFHKKNGRLTIKHIFLFFATFSY